MNWLGLIADILGVLSVTFAFLSWMQARKIAYDLKKERERQLRKIDVVLRSGPKSIRLPVPVRRADLTRSEILGRIGMIPLKSGPKRFSLEYLNTPEFLRRLDEIVRSDGDTVLEISCTEEEFNQFKLDS